MEKSRQTYIPPRLLAVEFVFEKGIAVSPPKNLGNPGEAGGAIPVIDENGDPLW